MTDSMELPSQKWCEQLGVSVIDPDGWDRTRFNEAWAEPITRGEFARRLTASTVRVHEGFVGWDMIDAWKDEESG